MDRILVEKYIEIYFPDISDENTIKNERKKVRNLLAKLNKPESVYKGLSFSCLNISEQVRLLHFILEEIDERQIVSNLNKIDADKDYCNLEMENEDTVIEGFFEDETPDFEPIDINSMLICCRKVIRSELEAHLMLDYLKSSNETLIQLLVDEINSFYAMGLRFENLTYIKEYVDYIINDIMQLVVYKIIRNSDIDTLVVLQELSKEVKKLTNELDVKLDEKRRKQKNDDILTASQVMDYFVAYLKHRSRLKEETDIYEELKKEAEQFPELSDLVKEEYIAEKVLLPEEDIIKYKEIIMEGDSIYRFKEKLSITRRFVDIMRDYGGRQCYSNCLQDLKVYFREIYISKATYRRLQAHKIVEDYIEKVDMAVEKNETIPEFDKKSQYLFVREKISRGYFREKGLLADYYAKITFTSELHDLLLKIYWLCDFEDALVSLYKVNANLLEKMRKLVII
ncbi:hypothetical protein D3Z58_23950 [Clostridiaceae bacterium]|nr:hypothetical protein [Clostridiaceae bacterium]